MILKRSLAVIYMMVYDKQIKDNIAAGLLVKNGDYLYLSQRGIDISNTVMSDFI